MMDGTFDEWADEGCPDEDDPPSFSKGDWVTSPEGSGIGTVSIVSDDTQSFYVCWPDGARTWHAANVLSLNSEQRQELPDVPHVPKPPLKILSYGDMVNLPDPEWLVEGLITEETSALLFGQSNSFKSFLAIDIACSVATGHLHNNWHGHHIMDGYEVLYVATEGSRGVAKQRVPGWYEAHNIPEEHRNGLHLYPEEIALDDEQSISNLLRSVAITAYENGFNDDWRNPALCYRLVVIDIFGASMMGPETSDETARAWVRNINHIMREMRCAVLTVAHTGWSEKHRARMHTHFWGSFDTRLIAEGDKDNLTTVLRVDRHKDAESEGEWGFRMEKVAIEDEKTTLVPRLCDDVETKQKRRVSGKPAIALQALSEALIEQGRTIAGPNYPSCPVVSVDVWKTMCSRHGLSESDKPDAIRKAFTRAKSTLMDKGFVRQFDDNVWKVPSDD